MIHESNVFKILKIPELYVEIKSKDIKVQTKLRPEFQCYSSLFRLRTIVTMMTENRENLKKS